jgi:hypothetical protein
MTGRCAERSAWIAAAIGLAGCVLCALVAPRDFPHAWVAALVYWIGWPLGSLALILIHALTGGRWGFAIRPQLAAGTATLPLVLPALVPLLLLSHALYPWMRPGASGLPDNRFYLNAPFFYIRVILYLVVWIGLAVRVLKALRQATPEPILYRLAPAGLILMMLTVTFSVIDFTLSMEPRFKSSICGMLAACTDVLLALSIALMAAALGRRPMDREAVHDLGRLLFALLVLWAYLDFMQGLIVWNSNLPDEAGWYAERLVGEWGVIEALIAALHFVLPFLVLVWAPMQRSRAVIGAVAAVLVLIQIPRSWWIVVPAARRDLSVIDAAAMLALLGVAAALALRSSRLAVRRPELTFHA